MQIHVLLQLSELPRGVDIPESENNIDDDQRNDSNLQTDDPVISRKTNTNCKANGIAKDPVPRIAFIKEILYYVK